jgi:hypothetical protein
MSFSPQSSAPTTLYHKAVYDLVVSVGAMCDKKLRIESKEE